MSTVLGTIRHQGVGTPPPDCSSCYADTYYPDHVVDKGRAILLRLCECIEAEFDAAGSEIETVAREAIGEDFWFVASSHGFSAADEEELIGARDW